LQTKLIARRAALAAAASCLLGFAVTSTAAPEPGRIIVPQAPGGATDKLARLLGTKLEQATGRTYIIENRTGAGGNIAAGQVAQAGRDSGTLLLVTGGILTINPFIYKSVPFDREKSFTLIAKWVDAPNIVFVKSDTPVKTFGEFLAWAKASPHPLSYGTSGIGSSQHLAVELLKSRTGLKFTHIPYKGGSMAVSDLAGGQVDFTFSSTAGLRLMEAGKLRPLAVTSLKRFGLLPDIPTIAELGIPGYEATAWYGVIGPAGMNAAEVARIAQAVKQLAADTHLAADLRSEGLDIDYRDGEEFRRYVQGEAERLRRVVEEQGMTAQ
jgi:tripartite-type tricarboxylate transporter receptor subunit TctC